MILKLDLRGERKLTLAQMVLQFFQERQYILLHGVLAVLDVRRPLIDVVRRDFFLSVFLNGSDSNLRSKFSREFPGVHIFVPRAANDHANIMRGDYVFLAAPKAGTTD